MCIESHGRQIRPIDSRSGPRPLNCQLKPLTQPPTAAGKKLPQKYHVFVDIFAWLLALAGLAFTLVLPTMKVVFAILERFYRYV